MTHTKELEITKNPRGWSVHSIQHWQGWPNPAHSHAPASSLAWAIFDEAADAADNDTTITQITVNGQPYPLTKVEAAVRKYSDHRIGYMVPKALTALGI